MTDLKFSSFQVVLPVCNESARVRFALDYICSFCSNVLVIDNFSMDDTVGIIREHFSSVTVVQIQNTGTTETPDWWRKATRYFNSPFVYFASCS
jgi:hypothetical protein